MFLLSRHSRRGVSGDVKLSVMRHRHSRSLLVAYVVYYVQAIEQKGDVSGSSQLTGCFFPSRIAWGSFFFTTLNSRETHLLKQSCILLRISSKELNSVDFLLPPKRSPSDLATLRLCQNLLFSIRVLRIRQIYHHSQLSVSYITAWPEMFSSIDLVAEDLIQSTG